MKTKNINKYIKIALNFKISKQKKLRQHLKYKSSKPKIMLKKISKNNKISTNKFQSKANFIQGIIDPFNKL